MRSRSRLAPSFVVTVAVLPFAPFACRTTVEELPPIAPDQALPLASSAPVASTSATVPVIDRWTVIQSGEKCTAVPDVACAGEPCPSPVSYECPKAVRNYPAHVQRVGGACKATFNKWASMPCPEGAYCNPPPPQPETVAVDCPSQ
ncbi:MAG: hypothetical protein ACXVEF_31330 [Polyangiales bacterium]